MSQKITIYDTEEAHNEIGQVIHDAKRRLLDAHKKGVPLQDAAETFFAECQNVIGRAEIRLRSPQAPAIDPPANPGAANEIDGETNRNKVFVSETDFDEIAHRLVLAFGRDEDRMAPAVVLLNYLWLALHKKLFTDTPFPIQVNPGQLVERTMRGIISRTIEDEQLERFGNEALKAFRKESRRLAPRSKGAEA